MIDGIPPEVIAEKLGLIQRSVPNPDDRLTPHECKIAALMMKMTDEEIRKRFSVCRDTLTTHMRNIFRKTGCSDVEILRDWVIRRFTTCGVMPQAGDEKKSLLDLLDDQETRYLGLLVERRHFRDIVDIMRIGPEGVKRLRRSMKQKTRMEGKELVRYYLEQERKKTEAAAVTANAASGQSSPSKPESRSGRNGEQPAPALGSRASR